MRIDRESDNEEKRDDRLPDRKTALFQAIKEILGMTAFTAHNIKVVRCKVAFNRIKCANNDF